MKKFYIMLLALILALAMIVPMTISVAAMSPNVMGFVSGSSFGGAGVQPELGFGGKVTLLADGTIVGNLHQHVFKGFDDESLGLPPDALADTEWICKAPSLTFVSSNIAIVGGMFKCVNNKYIDSMLPNGIPIFVKITDNGEPGVGYDVIEFLSAGAPPIIIEHGNFQVWVSDE